MMCREPQGAGPEAVDTEPTPQGPDLAQMVVRRLFGIGLILEAAAGVTEERGRHWLHEAVGEIDALIRDIRAAVFDRPA